LQRLLFLHGRWGYKRVGTFICYYFYKNVAMVLSEIFFAFFNGFSGQIFFLDWLPMLFNALWTSWPCMINFCLDKVNDCFLPFFNTFERFLHLINYFTCLYKRMLTRPHPWNTQNFIVQVLWKSISISRNSGFGCFSVSYMDPSRFGFHFW